MEMFKAHEIANIKRLSDLPEEIANEMRNIRNDYVNGLRHNDTYYVCLVSEDGTRYFSAHRHNDFNGYGSTGSHWNIYYGKISWHFAKNPIGLFEPEWCKGKTFGKSANGTEIPKNVGTKKEVMEIAKRIGIFNI